MLRRTSDIVLSVYLSRALAPLCTTQQSQRHLHSEGDRRKKQFFIKDLFMGKFNYALFDLPKVDSEAFSDLEVMTDSVEKFMTEKVDSRKIDTEAEIPEAILKSLAEMGLFGQQVPTEYGGLGLNVLKSARLAEVTAQDGAVSTTLAAHQNLGLKGLLLVGTPEQKEKYLPRLAAGIDLAAFCLTEPDAGSDLQSIQTRAVLSEDGSHYLLNGNKTWVSNGGLASIMTVFAKTETTDPDGKIRDRITAFIVERDFGGVTSGPPEDKLGNRGANSCTVTFDNTPVVVENVLGEVGKGFKLAMDILSSSRFSISASAIGTAKFLLKDSVEYALSRIQFNRTIGHFPLIKEKVGRIASDIYAMESMLYLTAGLADTFGESAVSLESAALKIFCSEALWRTADECLQIYGGLGYTKDYQQERFLRDARAAQLFGGTNELLRMMIAGSGCKYAGKQQADDLRRLHKPKENLFFLFRRKLDTRDMRTESSDPRVGSLVHPFMAPFALQLSTRTNFFRYVIPGMLVTYGHETIEHQMVLRRMADVAIDLYMCCAVVGRCSKVISEGYDDIEHNIDLATAALKGGLDRSYNNTTLLAYGQELTADEEDMQIADRMLRDGGYCALHPLTRNW